MNEQKTIVQEFEEEAIKELVAGILPKLKKYIPKIREELSKFLGKDEKLLLMRKEDDEIYLLVVETKGIKSLEIDEDSLKVYPIDNFVEILLSGDLSKLE